ncbi:hypothetical protein EDC04DRAFT_2742077 [Pisolithus marmoratus]|nr:hypothetical protein EDC04DRAFT_2742077 [Pisolithus marmoratus]
MFQVTWNLRRHSVTTLSVIICLFGFDTISPSSTLIPQKLLHIQCDGGREVYGDWRQVGLQCTYASIKQVSGNLVGRPRHR